MVSRKLILFTSLVSMGCGKTSIDALCADGCAGAETYFDRCASTFELNSSDGSFDTTACKTDCVATGEAADSDGCSDEFRAVATCLKRTNWVAMECSFEALFTLCAAEQSTFLGCQGLDSGGWEEWDSGDWDSGR
jgi:hypothetical protein